MNTAAALFLVSIGVFGRTYATQFRSSENPVSEQGAWINGAAVGLDWRDQPCAAVPVASCVLGAVTVTA